jgi:hypothetical protein
MHQGRGGARELCRIHRLVTGACITVGCVGTSAGVAWGCVTVLGKFRHGLLPTLKEY